ncbi:MAG: XRE family transcriptional regulator, partial [Vicinamibacterales bacterium]
MLQLEYESDIVSNEMLHPTSAVARGPAPDLVLAKAVLAAADRLGLRQRDLAEVIGASEATVSRMQRGRGLDPAGKEGELALLFLRVYRSLDAIMGGDDARSRAWLQAENTHLGGVPADRLKHVEGLVDVVQYLDAVRGH